MSVKAFYVLISRVRKFGALRVLQHGKEGLDDVAAKQHDEYLHAWEHGYDARGYWQGTLAAEALADIRRVRRAEEARRMEAKEREKGEKANDKKAARAAAAKAAGQASVKLVAAKRKAAPSDAPGGKRLRLTKA